MSAADGTAVCGYLRYLPCIVLCGKVAACVMQQDMLAVRVGEELQAMPWWCECGIAS